MLPRAVKSPAGMIAALVLPGLICCTALLPGCFSSCTGKGTPPLPPAAQSPVSPMPAPAVQTPVAPPPGSVVATPAAPPAAEPPKEPYVPKVAPQPPRPGLTLEGMRSIKDGMTFQEVRQVIGDPGTLVAGTDKASTVYRWNEAGLSFLARFEDGKLTRKSIISAEGGELSAEKAESKTIDKDLYDGIRAGMTFEEVMNQIGIEAQPISANGSKVVIYTWRDANGSSFTARFEDGKLVRKTGLYIAKGSAKGEGEPAASNEGESGGDSGAAMPDAGSADTTPNGQTTAANGADANGADGTAEATPPGPRKSRVTVAGTARREREAAETGDGQSDRSYRPKAQLPRNMRKLRDGSYEIRIHNTAESRVKAAVVSQEGATDLTIPSGGTKSVRVNQGDYTIQFIYDDDPYTLHKGGNIPIGQWLTDMEVFLLGGSYDVQVLDRSTDTPSSWNGPPRP